MDFSFLNNRIYLRLRAMLVTGKKETLPPERELAEFFGISRNTLRSALKKLEQEGLIRRQRKCGTSALPLPRSAEEKRILELIESKAATPYIAAHITAGAAERAREAGCEIDYCTRDVFDKMPADELAELLRERRIFGLVVHTGLFTGKEPLYFKLKSLGLPIVLPYCHEKDPETTGFAAIVNCQRLGWQKGLQYLAETGHKRIVALTTPGRYIRNIFSSAEYKSVLETLGLSPWKNPVLKCELDDRELRKKLAPLFLERKNPPDALLCYSDYWVPAVCRVLKALKIQIPTDVSVMGYCGALDSSFTDPELSSVVVEYSRIGAVAVEMLLRSEEWFNKKGITPPVETAPFHLKIRQSTAIRKPGT